MNRQEKEQFLIENYSKYTNKELAEILGYESADVVTAVASRLGLKKFYEVKDLDGEEWREHPEYPDYLISNKGRIKSKLRNKLIDQRVHEGYYDCRIKDKDGRKRSPRVHRLVAELFVANPEGKPVVNHIDGNKLNNSADNLEWVSYSENIQHAKKTGLSGTRKGTLTEEEVREICSLLQAGLSYSEIMKLNPRFTRSRVEKIRQRKRWTRISKDYEW